jgi:membrane protein YdbS with pleckstrin-like domain
MMVSKKEVMKIIETSKTKEEILTDNIPDHLDPNVKKYWLTTNLLGSVLFLGIFLFPLMIIAWFIAGMEIFVVLLLVLAIMITAISAIVLILINKIYDNITFLVRDEAITINRGILYKHSLTLPFNRVQNVNILRGPLERRFGIATIFIQTAGGYLLGGRLQGISDPELLRDIILKRVTQTKNNGL